MLPLLALLACVPDPSKRPPTPEDARDLSPSTTVETAQGPVIGALEDGVRSWKGVPFAAPPVGALRWRPAQPPPKRDAPFVADRSAPPCIQSDDWTQTRRPEASEDCLALNIWAPEGGDPKPVMLWIPGGGYISGANSLPLYDGARLAAAGDVVVVTLQYRLGPFGFLAHPAFEAEDPAWPSSGNQGLTDQLQALRWVQENIAAFGGDPGNVTLFGESAGGGSVCLMLSSPLTEGLFHRAIVQSGVCSATAHMRGPERGAGAMDSAWSQGQRFAEAAGCGQAPDVAACLRALPAEAVRHALPAELKLVEPGEAYGPIVDGHLIPAGPMDLAREGQTHPVPLIVGFNADEGSLFVNRRHIADTDDFLAYVRRRFPEGADRVLERYARVEDPLEATRALLGDDLFLCPSQAFARYHAAAGNDTYMYYLTHVSSWGKVSGLGAAHTTDLGLVFDSNMASTRPSPEPRGLVEDVQRWWTQFAQSGAPGAAGGLSWAPVDAGYVELAEPILLREGAVKPETCALLAELRGYDRPAAPPPPPEAPLEDAPAEEAPAPAGG